MKLRPCSFATTFELLEELDARHKAFVFAALDDTGGIVFDCKGGPVELLGLGEVAAIKAGNEAADDLDDDDDDCGGDCVGCPMLDPGKVAIDVANAVAPPPPVPAPPVVVKVDRRSSLMAADITHVVVEPSVGPGDIIPPLVEIDGVWGQDGSRVGSKFVGGGPSIYRRGRAATPAEAGTLIELTPDNRGYDVPKDVTHLVEVSPSVGDTVPEFYAPQSGGRWLKSVGQDEPFKKWRFEWRHARRARPDEIPAKPAPVVEMTPIVKPFRPLVSSSIPRLGFSNGPCSLRFS